jgi:hypothetical protein
MDANRHEFSGIHAFLTSRLNVFFSANSVSSVVNLEVINDNWWNALSVMR